jgi:hypothetical protein
MNIDIAERIASALEAQNRINEGWIDLQKQWREQNIERSEQRYNESVARYAADLQEAKRLNDVLIIQLDVAMKGNAKLIAMHEQHLETMRKHFE